MQQGEGSTSLGTYLVQLGQDAEALERFLKNRERAMSEAGLSESDRDLVLRGDVIEIRDALRQDFGDEAIAYIVHPGNWPIVHW